MTDANDLRLLIRKRGCIKQRLTLSTKYFTDLTNRISVNPINEIDKEIVLELECRFERINPLLEKLDDFQSKIESLHEENVLEKYVEDRENFQNE